MRSAAGGVDVAAHERHDRRRWASGEFVLRTGRQPTPRGRSRTRWAMSYLRGPLTQTQITALMRPGTRAGGDRTDGGATARHRRCDGGCSPTGPRPDGRGAAERADAPTVSATPVVPAAIPPLAGTTGPPIGMPRSPTAYPSRSWTRPPCGHRPSARSPAAPSTRPPRWPRWRCSSTRPRPTSATRSSGRPCCSRSPRPLTRRRSSRSTTTSATCGPARSGRRRSAPSTRPSPPRRSGPACAPD